MAVHHLVAHLAFGHRDLADPAVARRVWHCTRRAFPDALAAMIMLDHVHLMDECEDPDEAREKLGHSLSRATYGKGTGLWLPVPPAEVVDDARLRRVTRYVLLNPCRKGLVGDPLVWTWSTYRDAIGATADVWVPPCKVQQRLGYRPERFVESFHRYVTSDQRVRSDARSLPVPAPPSEYPAAGMDAIREAVAASYRVPVDEVGGKVADRRVFAALAREQGWRDTRAVAEALGVSRRTVQRVAMPEDDETLAAARLCLGAERLVHEVRGWSGSTGA